MSKLVMTKHGSTVHAGGYECEINGCHAERRHGGDGYAARWSIWRIGGQATWIACDICEGQDDSSDGYDSRSLYLILPLLHPSDDYARIAVEEMLYALAALGESACKVLHPAAPDCTKPPTRSAPSSVQRAVRAQLATCGQRATRG